MWVTLSDDGVPPGEAGDHALAGPLHGGGAGDLVLGRGADLAEVGIQPHRLKTPAYRFGILRRGGLNRRLSGSVPVTEECLRWLLPGALAATSPARAPEAAPAAAEGGAL